MYINVHTYTSVLYIHIYIYAIYIYIDALKLTPYRRHERTEAPEAPEEQPAATTGPLALASGLVPDSLAANAFDQACDPPSSTI